jgi:hypothetical protein
MGSMTRTSRRICYEQMAAQVGCFVGDHGIEVAQLPPNRIAAENDVPTPC